VSWQPPADTGGGSVTYTLVRHYQGESVVSGSNTTSTSITLAQNGGTNRYDYFTVTAQNPADIGPAATTS